MNNNMELLKVILGNSSKVSYTLPNLKNSMALVLSPHPDDETLGCGGAILNLLRQGREVEIVLLTNGGRGGKAENLVSVRLEEFENARKVLGCKKIHCLNFSDGQLSKCQSDVKLKLNEIIRGLNPGIIFTPYIFDHNPDHVLTSLILAECLERSSTVIALYEVWTPILFPDCYLNISDIFNVKLTAMECYKSQEKYYGIIGKTKALNMLRAKLSMRRNVKYIEAFKCFSAAEYSKVINALADNCL